MTDEERDARFDAIRERLHALRLDLSFMADRLNDHTEALRQLVPDKTRQLEAAIATLHQESR